MISAPSIDRPTCSVRLSSRTVSSAFSLLFSAEQGGAHDKRIVGDVESQSRERGIYEREKAVARPVTDSAPDGVYCGRVASSVNEERETDEKLPQFSQMINPQALRSGLGVNHSEESKSMHKTAKGSCLESRPKMKKEKTARFGKEEF